MKQDYSSQYNEYKFPTQISAMEVDSKCEQGIQIADIFTRTIAKNFITNPASVYKNFGKNMSFIRYDVGFEKEVLNKTKEIEEWLQLLTNHPLI